MAEIVWSDKSRRDLRAIVDYLRVNAPNYALVVARKIYASVTRLADYPQSGRVVPEIDDESIREIICDGFRVIYRQASSRVEVLTILHGRQQLPSDFKGK